MKQSQITLRGIQTGDAPALEEIIRKTWKYDALSKNPKDAQRMSRVFLRGCLLRATFSCVAEKDGRVLGAILVNSKNEKRKGALRQNFSFLRAVLSLLLTKRGRQIGRFFLTFEKIDNELLENCPAPFDGEICFFAVDEAARGTGVGKRLFSAAMEYLRLQKAKTFYLFTDTSCTYQFYEKRGMGRLGERLVDFKPHIDYRLSMFIYGGDLQGEESL